MFLSMIALVTMLLYNSNAFCIVPKRIKSDQRGLIDPTAPLPPQGAKRNYLLLTELLSKHVPASGHFSCGVAAA